VGPHKYGEIYPLSSLELHFQVLSNVEFDETTEWCLSFAVDWVKFLLVSSGIGPQNLLKKLLFEHRRNAVPQTDPDGMQWIIPYIPQTEDAKLNRSIKMWDSRKCHSHHSQFWFTWLGIPLEMGCCLAWPLSMVACITGWFMDTYGIGWIQHKWLSYTIVNIPYLWLTV